MDPEYSSPRDIPKVVVEEDVPSRSYYSSHINIEPGKIINDIGLINRHMLSCVFFRGCTLFCFD